MVARYDTSLIQYYEYELERLAPRDVEVNNDLLPIIGDLTIMLTENGQLSDDDSRSSTAWDIASSSESQIVYHHERTGWSVLLTWCGLHGVDGHRMEYFNHVTRNPGFVRKRDFYGSMEIVGAYQTFAMDTEKPFWDLFTALIERGEELPKLQAEDYARILANLETGLGSV